MHPGARFGLQKTDHHEGALHSALRTAQRFGETECFGVAATDVR